MEDAFFRQAQLPDALVRLGLSPGSANIYYVLLESGPLAPDALSERLSTSPAQLRRMIVELTGLDLVEEAGGRLVPLDPSHGMDTLKALMTARFRRATRAATSLYETYERAKWTSGSELRATLLRDDEVITEVKQIEAAARESVKVFDRPPYRGQEFANPEELAALARGVEYRTIYARDALTDPGRYEGNVLPCIAAGEQARVLGSVPAKAFIVDDEVAVVALTTRDVNDHHTAVILRHESMLGFVLSTFEICWSIAMPVVGPSPVGQHEISDIESAILRYLAIGATDEAIARNLRVSRRTVVRHVARLMAMSDTQSRFQLAIAASSRGWLKQLDTSPAGAGVTVR